MDVKVDDNMLGKDGFPDIAKIKPVIFGPETLTYHGVGEYLGQAFSVGKEIG
jgi:hypothetical protein